MGLKVIKKIASGLLFFQKVIKDQRRQNLRLRRKIKLFVRCRYHQDSIEIQEKFDMRT